MAAPCVPHLEIITLFSTILTTAPDIVDTAQILFAFTALNTLPTKLLNPLKIIDSKSVDEHLHAAKKSFEKSSLDSGILIRINALHITTIPVL